MPVPGSPMDELLERDLRFFPAAFDRKIWNWTDHQGNETVITAEQLLATLETMTPAQMDRLSELLGFVRPHPFLVLPQRDNRWLAPIYPRKP